jgi:hypothetical protein
MATYEERLAPAAVAVIVAYHVLSAGQDERGSAVETSTEGGASASAAGVHDLVERRLAGDKAGAAALAALQSQPTSEVRRAALAAALEIQVRADSNLGVELGRLVEQALASTAVHQTILTVYGYEQATAIEGAALDLVSKESPTPAQHGAGSPTNE